jgi:hypothetical protein
MPMPATITQRDAQRVTVEVTVELSDSMLSTEEAIQTGLNEAGVLLTDEALKAFDTDGGPIEWGGEVWTSKGQQPKYYQTPYGEVSIERHVYQRSRGGKTYCPLEQGARIVITSTPQFARQVSSKFAYGAAQDVHRDLSENHGRRVARSYIQRLAEAVASVAQAKEETWSYVPPALASSEVATVAIGLDGTTLLLCEDQWREAMVGTVSLYDAQGERRHTVYLGASPEYGRDTFLKRLTREVNRAKERYPKARWVGIADGAESNWRYLKAHTETQILDFYHASGYLSAAARALRPDDAWEHHLLMETFCHELKHDAGGAEALYGMLQTLQQKTDLSKAARAELDAAVTYFKNHRHQMDYAGYREQQFPIGSGVTEAACKTLVKQRFCRSGMRWKDRGVKTVMSLRELVLTSDRWKQFWSKLNQHGFPVTV